MKWEEDLIRDIRTGTELDDQDVPFGHLLDLVGHAPFEFMPANHEALDYAIKLCKNPKVFVEIGVHRNNQNSSTHTILKNKPDDGIYLGIDVEDKSFLDNPALGIHTIKTTSSNYDLVIEKLKSLGVSHIDFLFIDGWHSINQVLDDWEYTRILSPNGVVAFHDVTAHPGPYYFIRNLNKEKWDVCENACPADNGLGFCVKI